MRFTLIALLSLAVRIPALGNPDSLLVHPGIKSIGCNQVELTAVSVVDSCQALFWAYIVSGDTRYRTECESKVSQQHPMAVPSGAKALELLYRIRCQSSQRSLFALYSLIHNNVFQDINTFIDRCHLENDTAAMLLKGREVIKCAASQYLWPNLECLEISLNELYEEHARPHLNTPLGFEVAYTCAQIALKYGLDEHAKVILLDLIQRYPGNIELGIMYLEIHPNSVSKSTLTQYKSLLETLGICALQKHHYAERIEDIEPK